MLSAANDGQVYALCLLNLTAAFDNVDHDLLMLRLQHQFGLRGVVSSPVVVSIYLSGRTLRVLHGGSTYSIHGLHRALAAVQFFKVLSLGSAIIHLIYRGLGRRYREAQYDITRVCRRVDDTAVSAMSS